MIEQHKFPLFFSLQFRADWLITKPSSGSKFLATLNDCARSQIWTESELPVLYTPVNSITGLCQRRLIIQLIVYEREKKKTFSLAYVNVRLKDIRPIMGSQTNQDGVWDFELPVQDLKIIAHNKSIGKFSANLRFRVIGAPLH